MQFSPSSWSRPLIVPVCSLLAFAACSSGGGGGGSSNRAALEVHNRSSQSDYDVVIDGSIADSVARGSTQQFTLAAGSHRVELRFRGSQLAARGEQVVAIGAGQVMVLESAADCRAQNFGGIRVTNNSRQTTYLVRYGNDDLARLAPGEVSGVVPVGAGVDRLEIKSPNGTILCSSNVSTASCQVVPWSCSVEECAVRHTGKITFRNGFSVTTVLTVAGTNITLQPGQTTVPLTLSAGSVQISLRRADNGAVLCSGPVSVVECQTRPYQCP